MDFHQLGNNDDNFSCCSLPKYSSIFGVRIPRSRFQHFTGFSLFLALHTNIYCMAASVVYRLEYTHAFGSVQ